jgi:hypothetical protein
MGKLVRLFVMSRQGFNMDRGIGKRDGSVQSKKDVDLAEICDQHDSSLGVKVVLGREGGDGNVLEGLVTDSLFNLQKRRRSSFILQHQHCTIFAARFRKIENSLQSMSATTC